MTRQLTVEVFFDFICPWCLIGKRQFQRALAQLHNSDPDVDVKVIWRGVQLLPHIPVNGEPFAEFYLQRLGSPQAVSMRQAQVREAASAVGVNIDFATIARMPNTYKAHQLLAQALQVGTTEQCDKLLERLFAAYFHNSEDLADTAVLLKIAESCGFSAELLGSGLDKPFASANTGGNGVPYFVFAGRLALAGAHPAEALYRAMQEGLAAQGQVQ